MKEENYKGGLPEVRVEEDTTARGQHRGFLGVLELYFIFFPINTNFIQLI